MKRKHEAIVVGGGVVGAATALALFRQGLDVALVERGPAPHPSPLPASGEREQEYDLRVYALSPGSVRFLDSLGVWSRVAAKRVSPFARMQVWENEPAQALTFDAAELAASELGFIVEDNLLRGTLWTALGSAAVHADSAVTSLQAGEKSSRVALANGATLEAPLVIGAEGADSPLREWAGIEPVGWSYPQRSVVCHVQTGEPHYQTAYQRFLPNGPLAFLPLADGRSSIVWSTTPAEADALLEMDDGEFCARLADALGDRLGAITGATKRLSFPLRLLHAQNYVRPGLALVGDSAHVIHPLAGQGMNLGLADGAALAETLAQARSTQRSLGNLRVLKRYERARKADNVEVLALTDGLHRLFASRLPAVGELRQLGLSLAGRVAPLKRALARRAMG